MSPRFLAWATEWKMMPYTEMGKALEGMGREIKSSVSSMLILTESFIVFKIKVNYKKGAP